MVCTAWCWKAAIRLSVSIKLWPPYWLGQQFSAKEAQIKRHPPTSSESLPGSCKGIKHDVTRRQLPSCLLSALCTLFERCVSRCLHFGSLAWTAWDILYLARDPLLENHSLSVSPETFWGRPLAKPHHRASVSWQKKRKKKDLSSYM